MLLSADPQKWAHEAWFHKAPFESETSQPVAAAVNAATPLSFSAAEGRAADPQTSGSATGGSMGESLIVVDSGLVDYESLAGPLASLENADVFVLDAYAGELAAWGRSLAPGGDVLLYGCNVAAGPVGRAFVRGLAASSGADVAASVDPTGNLRLGGDSALEFQTGHVAAPLDILTITVRGEGNVEISDDATTPNRVTAAGNVEIVKAGRRTNALDLSPLTMPVTVTIKKGGEVVAEPQDEGVGDTLITVDNVTNINRGNGNQDDRLIVERGAALPGTLDGGGGTNTLDYSGTDPTGWLHPTSYSANVTVNLTDQAQSRRRPSCFEGQAGWHADGRGRERR